MSNGPILASRRRDALSLNENLRIKRETSASPIQADRVLKFPSLGIMTSSPAPARVAPGPEHEHTGADEATTRRPTSTIRAAITSGARSGSPPPAWWTALRSGLTAHASVTGRGVGDPSPDRGCHPARLPRVHR